MKYWYEWDVILFQDFIGLIFMKIEIVLVLMGERVEFEDVSGESIHFSIMENQLKL